MVRERQAIYLRLTPFSLGDLFYKHYEEAGDFILPLRFLYYITQFLNSSIALTQQMPLRAIWPYM